VSLHLTTSKRSASTIDVATTFMVATSAGTAPYDIEVTDKWKSVEISGEKFEARIGKESMFGGKGIELRPSSARRLFDSCSVIVDGQPVESMGTLESMGTITFSIDEDFTLPATVRFMVHSDYRKEAVQLTMKAQQLP
jgi:hypothetical protein